MKCYYVPQSSRLINRALPCIDSNRINRDKNKIVITRINGVFHVLNCKNGVYDKEKMVLSYFDLVNFLKRVSFNIYFVNVPFDTISHILSYVKEDYVCKEEKVGEVKEDFYAIGDGNLYKLETYINRNTLKKAIYTTYGEEANEDMCYEISLGDFIDNEELFGLYHFPFVERNGQFLIPEYSYAKPKSFYILSGIYNKNSDEMISLSSTDLKNICMIGTIEKEMASELLSNVEIRIIEQNSLEAANNVVDFLEKRYNGDNKNCTRLKLLKDHLLEGKKNQMIYDTLKLAQDNDEKEHVLNK